MVVRPHAYGRRHNVLRWRELLREQSIRRRNSTGKEGRWAQWPVAATRVGRRQSRQKPLRVLRPQRVESLHPHFSIQVPWHPPPHSDYARIAPPRSYRNQELNGYRRVHNCSRTDSAGRREPTLQTRVSTKLDLAV